MTTKLLEVEHLRIEVPTRRGVQTAVDDISFTIASGEVLGVVGESGAGKSLTGAAIIGLLEPPLRIAGGQVLLFPLFLMPPWMQTASNVSPVKWGILALE